MPSQKLDDARGAMKDLRESQSAALKQLREDRNLSANGRLRKVADIHKDHRDRAAALRKKFDTGNETSRAVLQRQLFGIPHGTEAADYRDAAGRVGELTGTDQLREVIASARLSGDTTLERAAAARAYTLGHQDLVDDYAATNGHTDSLDELRGLPSAGETNLGMVALFSVGTPDELRSMGQINDATLTALIEAPDTKESFQEASFGRL